MKPKPIALIIHFRRELAALCAGLAALTVASMIHPMHSQRILVASHDLAAGHTVTASDVTSVDSTYSWATSVTDPSELIGQTTLVSLAQGVPLTYAFVSTSNGLSALPVDEVAVVIPVSTGERDLVRDFSTVTVYSTSQTGIAQLVARAATVLPSSPSTTHSMLSPSASDSFLTIAVTPSEAFLIAQAKTNNTFSIALNR